MATYEIVVVANADQAEAVMSRLATKIGTAGAAAAPAEQKVVSLTDRLAAMGPAGQVGANAIDSVAAKLTGGLGFASTGAASAVESLDAKLGGLSTGMLAAGAGAAAYAATALVTYEVVKKSVEAFTAQAEAVKHTAELTQMSTQQASVFNAAMAAMGINIDNADRALGILAANIDKGSLAKYGIEVARNADKTVNFSDTLTNVANKFAQTADATQRDAMAKALLGRSYQELLPLLNKGGDYLKQIEQLAAQHTAILSPQDIQNAEQLKIQTAALHDEITKLWVEIGSKLVPSLIDLAAGLTRVITDVDHFVERNEWLITGLKGLASALSVGVLPALELLGRHSGEAASAQAAATEEYNRAKQSIDAETQALEKLNTELANSAKAADTFASADIASRQAELALAQEQAAWAKKVADAEKQRADAIAKANRDIKDSTQALRDAEIRASEDIAAAKHDLLRAQQQLRDDSAQDLNAARGVEDAQTRLARIKADIAAGRLAGVDAIRQEQDAEQAVTRAKQDQTIASAKQKQHIEEDKYAIAQAEQHLADVERTSTEAVAAAKQKLADAQTALNKAQNQAAISAADYAQHELAVESATLAVYNAHVKLQGAINDIKNGLAHNTLNAQALENTFNRMGLTSMPAFKAQLALLLPWMQAYAQATQAAASAQASLANTLHINPVPSSIASTSSTSSGGASMNVTVQSTGLIFDPTSANTVGVLVANGVIQEIRRRMNAGENVFPFR